MDKFSLEAVLESLLFVSGEPLSVKKLAEIISISEEEIIAAAEKLSQNLNQSERGLVLLKNENTLQLATKPSLANFADKLIEKELKEELSPATVEVLAVLAYGGPLSRAAVEYIRGVNSSYILRNLLMRSLIEKKDGKYQVSFDLLKRLGLASLKGLPDYERYQELISKFGENNQ